MSKSLYIHTISIRNCTTVLHKESIMAKYNTRNQSKYWESPEGIYNEAKKRAFQEAPSLIAVVRALGINADAVSDDNLKLLLIDEKEKVILAYIAERANKEAEAKVDPFSYEARRKVQAVNVQDQAPVVEAPVAPQEEVVAPLAPIPAPQA